MTKSARVVLLAFSLRETAQGTGWFMKEPVFCDVFHGHSPVMVGCLLHFEEAPQ